MLLVLLPLGVAAQKPLDEVARIKANDDYIWGEGRGDTDAKATQSALNDLISCSRLMTVTRLTRRRQWRLSSRPMPLVV